MGIVEFLEARITEDEVLARDVLATVAPNDWENPTSWGNFFPADIAFWDSQTPYRVIAECAAKRAVIGWWTNGVIGYVEVDGELTNPMLPLAAIYADHPDYQQEWAA